MYCLFLLWTVGEAVRAVTFSPVRSINRSTRGWLVERRQTGRKGRETDTHTQTHRERERDGLGTATQTGHAIDGRGDLVTCTNDRLISVGCRRNYIYSLESYTGADPTSDVPEPPKIHEVIE